MNEGKRAGIGEAVGKVVSGVSVVTSRAGEQTTGLLLGWVQQVAFNPPMVVVSIKKNRPIEQLIQTSRSFAVCVLAEDDNHLMRHFSRGYELAEDAFAGLKTQTRVTGAPVLSDSMAFMDCRLVGSMEVGDHVLYLGEVVDGGMLDSTRRPAVHIRKTGFSY